MVDAGEQCDDGNQVRGDCCTPTCTLEQDGSVCDDGDPCTRFAACNNAGRCVGLGCDSGASCGVDGLTCGAAGERCECSLASTPALPVCQSESRVDDEATLRAAVKRLERKGFRLGDGDEQRYFAPTLIEAAQIVGCDPAEWIEPTKTAP
jgi:cysteine-rich repeat protein